MTDPAPSPPAAHASGSAQDISSFYAQMRDYWGDLSSFGAPERSIMLNFGYWPAGVETLYAAQWAFLRHIAAQLPKTGVQQQGVEVGCGIGGVSINLLGLRPDVQRMTAVDISAGQLALARANAERAGVQDRFVAQQGDAMNLPLDNAQFDFLLCIESSFHYEDKPRFLREALRVLKPGGTAVVADITCRRPEGVEFRQGNHFESADQYLRWMEEAGFKIVAHEDIGPQLYTPLYQFMHHFNTSARPRTRVERYWSLVLGNYQRLAAQGDMGYHLFTLRK